MELLRDSDLHDDLVEYTDDLITDSRLADRTMKIYQFIVAAVLVFAALAVAQETTRSDAFITADADSDGTLSEDEIGGMC